MTKSEHTLPDTNVILRYLLNDQPEQFALAEAFFGEVRTGRKKAVVLEGVIVECLHVLTKFYKVPRPAAAAPLAELMRYKGIVNHDAATLIRALELYAQSGFDPVDCLLAATAERGKGTVFTFDQKLQKLAAGERQETVG